MLNLRSAGFFSHSAGSRASGGWDGVLATKGLECGLNDFLSWEMLQCCWTDLRVYSSENLHWEWEDDGVSFLGTVEKKKLENESEKCILPDGVEGVEVTELHCSLAVGNDGSGLGKGSRCSELSFGGNNLKLMSITRLMTGIVLSANLCSGITGGLSLGSHGTLHLLWQTDITELNTFDFDSPWLGGFVKGNFHISRDFVTGGEDFGERVSSQDGTEGGLSQKLGGLGGILNSDDLKQYSNKLKINQLFLQMWLGQILWSRQLRQQRQWPNLSKGSAIWDYCDIRADGGCATVPLATARRTRPRADQYSGKYQCTGWWRRFLDL